MFAARYGSNPEVITALLEAGADAKAKDQDGKTALDHAKENEKIYKTKAYWELNDAYYEDPDGLFAAIVTHCHGHREAFG